MKIKFILSDLFQAQSVIKTSRNNWKPLFEVNYRENSTKTIRLFALDFYEGSFDEAESLVDKYGLLLTELARN